MPEVKMQAASRLEGLEHKAVHFFIGSHFFTLQGNWKWELETSELFCSEVMLSLDDQGRFHGQACLIHPEDLQELIEAIHQSRHNRPVDFNFRIITSYGKIRDLKGSGHFEYEEQEDFLETFCKESQAQVAEEKEKKKAARQDSILLKTWQFSERITGTGIWYINTATHEAFYSDGVFRIHNLPPQSLNPHFQTFTTFIHPDDKDTVTTALDKGYKEQLALCLEYRILISQAEVRYIRLTTRWIYNELGQNVVAGLVEDITDLKTEERQLEAFKNELSVKDKLLLHAEGLSRSANWYIHLPTRKVNYSEQVYRIYGLKPGPVPVSGNLLMKYVHPDDRDHMLEVNRRILNEHVPPDLSYRIIRPDGKTRYLQQKGKVILDNSGEEVMIGTIMDVTETELTDRKYQKMKNELEVQQFAFSHIEEMSGIGSWLWDINTGEINWSPGFYQLLGYKPNSVHLSQRVLLNYIHPDDKKEFTDRIAMMLQDETEIDFSFRIIRKSETRFLQAHFRIDNSTNRPVFFATVQDKTGETMLQRLLTEQVHLAELLSDASTDRVFVTDVNNYIVRWNRRCEEYYGIKREKVIARNFFDVLPKLQTPQIISWYQQALKGEHIYVKDHKSILHNGYQDMSFVPLKDEENNILAVLTIIHDTTREYELRQQLTERLHFIEKLLEAIVDRIIVLDRNMNYQYWNKRAEDYYGVKKEEVLGKNILEVFPGFMDDPTYLEFRRALKGYVVHIPANRNLEAKKGYFETYLIPVKNDQQEITGVLWIVHDLTNEVILKRDQRRAYEILDTINEACYEVDHNGNLIFLNRQAEEVWHMDKKDLIGKNIWEVLPEAINTFSYQAIREALEMNKSSQQEFLSPILNKWISINVTPSEHGAIVLFFDISAIKETRERLELEHKRLKEAQAIGHFGSFELQIADSKVIWSDELFRIHGLIPQSEEITMDTLISFVHPEDQQVTIEAVGNIIKTGAPLELEQRIILRDGKMRFVRRVADVARDEQGKIIKIFGTVQDITDQKISELNLKASNDMLQGIIHAPNVNLALYRSVRDASGNIIDFEMLLLSRSREMMMGGNNHVGKSLLHEFAGSELFFETYKEVVASGLPKTMELPYSVPGKKKWFRLQLVKHGDGLLDVWEDITDRKLAEEEVIQGKMLLEAVFNASTFPISYFKSVRNEQGIIIDFEYVIENLPARQFLGTEETVGRLLEVCPITCNTVFFDEFRKVVETGQPIDKEQQYAEEGIDKWYHVTAVKLGDGFVTTVEDITERKMAEARMNELEYQLKHAAHAANEAFIVYDMVKQHHFYLNDHLANWLGYLPEQMKTMSWKKRLQLFTEEDIEKLAALLDHMKGVRDEELCLASFGLKPKRGEMILVKGSFRVLKRDAQGKVIQLLVSLQKLVPEETSGQEYQVSKTRKKGRLKDK